MEERVSDRPIRFTIARALVEQAARENRPIHVTVSGPYRILARLGEPTKETSNAQG
jgi:hypothetical protein